MSRNTLIVVAFAVLLLALAVWRSLGPVERGISRLSFAELDAPSIDRVEITGNNPATLVKSGGAWTVDGKEADANAVKILVEAIPRIVSSDLVTSSPARFTDLGVDDTAGVRVKAFAGGKGVAEFVVGKSAGGGLHVRAGDDVYLVSKLSASTFAREKKLWVDRKLFRDAAAALTRVDVRRPAGGWSLVKKDETWALEDPSLLPKGFRFDANAARSFALALANATADDVPDADPGAAVTGLEAEAAERFTLVLGTSGAATRELVLGNDKEGDSRSVWARASTRAYPVTVSSGLASQLRRSPADFRDLGLMSFDRTKVKKLSVDGGKERWTAAKGADGVWKLESHSEKLPEGFELDPAAIDRRIAQLASARAQKPGVSFTASGAKVVATLEGGGTATLVFGATKKEDDTELVEVRGNVDGTSYLAGAGLKSSLTAGVASLRRTSAGGMPALDPEALQGLPPEVREAFLQQQREREQQAKLLERLQKTPPAKPSPTPAAP